jgi:hypothetical protein
MLDIFIALFRIPHLLRIERSVSEVNEQIRLYDEHMNGTEPDFDDARPPNGDDYNVVLSILGPLLSTFRGY